MQRTIRPNAGSFIHSTVNHRSPGQATEYTINNDGSDSESNASSNVSVEGKVNEQGENGNANEAIRAAADHESCDSVQRKSQLTDLLQLIRSAAIW